MVFGEILIISKLITKVGNDFEYALSLGNYYTLYVEIFAEKIPVN